MCKDTASFPYKACVYCQIDVTTKEEASEDQYYSAEVRFAPTQGPNSPTPNGTETLTDSVELIFQAFSEGAKLNPDKANGEEGSTPGNPFEALASMMAMMGSSSTDLPNEQDPEENIGILLISAILLYKRRKDLHSEKNKKNFWIIVRELQT